MVWLDIGGGTARNLEFFTVAQLRKHFAKIVVLDISASLLAQAKQRVAAAGLDDLVELVHADFTNLPPAVHQRLAAAPANLITFSYSLSMIPDKRAALREAERLLDPTTGYLCIADFWGRKAAADGRSSVLESLYDAGCRLWFRQDNVHLLSDKLFASLHAVQPVHQRRWRGAVPFIPALRPWHGIWIGRRCDQDQPA